VSVASVSTSVSSSVSVTDMSDGDLSDNWGVMVDLDWVGVVSGSSGVGGSSSWFVGLDGCTESVTVSNVVHLTVDSTGIGESVRTVLVVVSVRNFFTMLLGSVMIGDLVTEFVRLGSVNWFHMLGDSNMAMTVSISTSVSTSISTSVSTSISASISTVSSSISAPISTESSVTTSDGGGNGQTQDEDLDIKMYELTK